MTMLGMSTGAERTRSPWAGSSSFGVGLGVNAAADVVANQALHLVVAYRNEAVAIIPASTAGPAQGLRISAAWYFLSLLQLSILLGGLCLPSHTLDEIHDHRQDGEDFAGPIHLLIAKRVFDVVLGDDVLDST